MEDVVRAFKGNFLHKEGPQYKWAEFTGKVPYPRPGTVSWNSELSSLYRMNHKNWQLHSQFYFVISRIYIFLCFHCIFNNYFCYLSLFLYFFVSQCPSSTYGSYSSTREYPDDVIFFSRTHPLLQVQLMFSSIQLYQSSLIRLWVILFYVIYFNVIINETRLQVLLEGTPVQQNEGRLDCIRLNCITPPNSSIFCLF